MMEDHYHDLAHDSSVVHFYFDDLYKEKETTFERPAPLGNIVVATHIRFKDFVGIITNESLNLTWPQMYL